jgi:small nuclear ribonucleoprotein (snRNP)-like protein
MSERGHQRGGRGGGRGEHRGGRGGRGGHGGERGGHGHGGGSSEKPKKENILDLGKYMDKQVTVKFNGGREGMFQVSLFRVCENINNWRAVKGTLKGYDALMNLVLDDVEEKLTGTYSALCVPVGSLTFATLQTMKEKRHGDR